MAQLRRLERMLVTERFEIGIDKAVTRLIERWCLAVDQKVPPPDSLEFTKDLIVQGFYLPTATRAIQYLDGCRGGGELPEHERVVKTLLPWTSGRV